MPQNVPCKTCDQVSDCSVSDWDILFCICTADNQAASVCTPVTVGEPVITDFPELRQITDAGKIDQAKSPAGNPLKVVGAYSTTATVADTMSPPNWPNLGGPWGSISNALDDNGSYASVDGGVSNTCAIAPAPHPAPLCPFGSDFIVLTDYGFNIPANATILGIAVGVKGYGEGATSGYNARTLNVPITPYNVALMSGGVPYFAQDPRSDLCLSNSFETDAVSHAPYPEGNWLRPQTTPMRPEFTQGSGIQYPGFVAFDGGDPDLLVGDQLFALGIGLGLGIEFTQGVTLGTLDSCGYPFQDLADVFGPMQKNFSIPTLKQPDPANPLIMPGWTAAEINDPSFGVALSLGGYMINNFGEGPDRPPGYPCNLTSTVSSQQHLNCIGIAVYYTMTPAAGGQQPNTFVIT